MKKMLLGVCLLLLTGVTQAQSQVDKKLIAPETWVALSGKSSFRVITSNDSMSSRIMRYWYDSLTRFNYIQKKDRRGYYWERSFYFKNELYNSVILFIGKLKQ